MNELTLLSKASEKRVLFVGETIIDVYHYVRPLGRPLKESIVSVEHISTETFQGGVVAAAAHAREFCKSVEVFSAGSKIIKERWVEQAHNRKLFEMYVDHGADPRGENALFPWITHDVVVVADYGHGMMDDETILRLRAASYLAVNVQTNSGNFGFNLATKYNNHGVDYLVVDEPEARLATTNQYESIERSLEWLRILSVWMYVPMELSRRNRIGRQTQQYDISGTAFTAFLKVMFPTLFLNTPELTTPPYATAKWSG